MRRAVAVFALAAMLVAGGVAIAAEHLLLPEPDGEVLGLLLLGSDGGPPRGDRMLTARADGVQLLFVSGDRRHATFVSIPRDSWIHLPGRGNNRVNACLNHGPESCVEAVEAEFGINLDGHLTTSMDGFKAAVSAFGGLVVDVPTPVFDGGMSIPEAGRQRLTGSQALTYGRDRKNRAGGDFGRSQAQAEMLALAHRHVAEGGDLDEVLEAATILRRHTVTDLGGPNLLRLAYEALHLPPDNVERALAPGRHGWAGPAAVVYLEPAAYDLVTDAAEDGRLSAPAG